MRLASFCEGETGVLRGDGLGSEAIQLVWFSTGIAYCYYVCLPATISTAEGVNSAREGSSWSGYISDK